MFSSISLLNSGRSSRQFDYLEATVSTRALVWGDYFLTLYVYAFILCISKPK